MKKIPLLVLALLNIGTACSKETSKVPEGNITLNHGYLIYLHEARMEKVKEFIEKKETYFTDAYNQLVTEANKELAKTANPVTLKTQTYCQANSTRWFTA